MRSIALALPRPQSARLFAFDAVCGCKGFASTPRNPNWKKHLISSFNKQTYMAHLGARLDSASFKVPGAVDISCDYATFLLQQHGFFHGGVTTAIADSAAGYAAFTLMDPGSGVLTTEFKINLLNPAEGDRLVARGRVIKPGRTLSICRADVYGITESAGGVDTNEVHVATGLFTMMQMPGIELNFGLQQIGAQSE